MEKLNNLFRNFNYDFKEELNAGKKFTISITNEIFLKNGDSEEKRSARIFLIKRTLQNDIFVCFGKNSQ